MSGISTYVLPHIPGKFEDNVVVGPGGTFKGHLGADVLVGVSDNTLKGNWGTDTLVLLNGGTAKGGWFADTLVFGYGNETMKGGWGADTYVVENHIYGQDVIKENGRNAADSLVFYGLDENDVCIQRDGDNMVITDICTGGTITILNQFAGANKGVEYISFVGCDCDPGGHNPGGGLA